MKLDMTTQARDHAVSADRIGELRTIPCLSMDPCGRYVMKTRYGDGGWEKRNEGAERAAPTKSDVSGASSGSVADPRHCRGSAKQMERREEMC